MANVNWLKDKKYVEINIGGRTQIFTKNEWENSINRGNVYRKSDRKIISKSL